MIRFIPLHPKVTDEHLGFLPDFFDEADPRSASEQLNERYAHGGGYRPNPKWRFNHETHCIQYPGDPVLRPLAVSQLHGETLLFYPGAWLCIVQPGAVSFAVTRVD